MTSLSLLSISHVLLWEASILDMAYMRTLPIKFEKLSDVGILIGSSTKYSISNWKRKLKNVEGVG